MSAFKQPCVYILAIKRNGTLYVGTTNDLAERRLEHRSGQVADFKKEYGVHKLVYYEAHDAMPAAIAREKQIKQWNDVWKFKLIEEKNPEWRDLWQEVT